MGKTELPLMESFYTLQGEGVYNGVAAYFIRLAGCDVGCVWCDVKESWDASNYPKESAATLTQQALESGTNVVVITGGEPAMYDLTELTTELKKNGLRTHIETSAAYPIVGDFDWICISPKKFKFPLDSELEKADELKIIAFNNSDFDWAKSFETKIKDSCQLLIQPEWDKREIITPKIIEFIKSNPKWRLSLQTHKYLGIP